MFKPFGDFFFSKTSPHKSKSGGSTPESTIFQMDMSPALSPVLAANVAGTLAAVSSPPPGASQTTTGANPVKSEPDPHVILISQNPSSILYHLKSQNTSVPDTSENSARSHKFRQGNP